MDNVWYFVGWVREERHLTQEEEVEQAVKQDVEARVREGVKAGLEEVLREEMTEHLKAGYREPTPTRKGASATATTPVTSSPPRARR